MLDPYYIYTTPVVYVSTGAERPIRVVDNHWYKYTGPGTSDSTGIAQLVLYRLLGLTAALQISHLSALAPDL